MKEETFNISGKAAKGYTVSFGDFSLVFAKTDKGMVGCGLFDVSVFDRFGYPAAKAKAKEGLISDIPSLLSAEIVAANSSAEKAGVRTGMTGAQALELMK